MAATSGEGFERPQTVQAVFRSTNYLILDFDTVILENP